MVSSYKTTEKKEKRKKTTTPQNTRTIKRNESNVYRKCYQVVPIKPYTPPLPRLDTCKHKPMRKNYMLLTYIPSFRYRDNSVHFLECSPFWLGISTICL